MKIGFCSLALKSGHKVRGIGFYTKNLLDGISKIKGVEIKEFGDISELDGADVVHYPYFDLFYKTLKVTDIPTVITIHDVTPLIFPKNYPPGLRGASNFKQQKEMLKKVKMVITDSDASKKDIVKYLEVPEDKVKTVYLAPAKHFKVVGEAAKTRVRKKYDLPDKFLLYVGDVNFNKNIPGLIKVSAAAGIPLVIAGKQATEIDNIKPQLKGPKDYIRLLLGKTHPEIAHFSEVSKLIKENNVKRLGFVSDEDLVAIYNCASALMQVSFYEGFGLPILEAQACGVPVITSNISSMPEIAGDGACLVDPYVSNEILKAIDKVVSDDALRSDLIKRGFENVNKFSWEKCIKEMYQIYNETKN